MATGPIDYTRGFGQVSPFGNILQGLEAGAQFAGIEQARELRGLQMQAAQQAQAERAAQMERETALSGAMTALVNNPNPTFQDYQRVAMMLPADRSKALMEQFNAMNADRQQNELRFAGNVLASIRSGSPEVGIGLIRERIDAERNSGRPDGEQRAKGYETWLRLVEVAPEQAGATIGALVSQLPGADKLMENLTRVGTERRAEEMFPSQLAQSRSEAQSAAVKARFAESKAVADLALTNAQILGLADDREIKRQNVQIARLNAQISAENNALRRQELEQRRIEAAETRDRTARERIAELNSARGNIDNFLNTADRALNTPKNVIGSAAGPVSARIPTTFQATADFEMLVETLGAQSFLSQIPNIKGMGQLSNAEGEKLQAALQNLSLRQSPEQLTANIREAQRLMLKARRNIEERFGAAPSVPDTPAARTAAPTVPGGPVRSVDDLVRQYTAPR